MRLSTLTALSVGAAFSTMQYCPAPFLAASALIESLATTVAVSADATLASGAIAGGIGRIPSVKRGSSPPGVSQHAWDECTNQLKGGHVHLSRHPSSNSKFSRKGLYHIESLTNTTDVRVDGVPPACMNLATVLIGQPTQEGGPVPVPMGSASLEYQDLTHDELMRLAHTLEANGDVQ